MPPSYPPVSLQHTALVPYYSQVMQRGFQLSVFTPWNYTQTMERYPVMYLLDAEFNFPLMLGLQDGAHFGGKTPMMMIVAVGYGEPYGVMMKERARDFTPVYVGQIENSGKADRYLKFVEQELIPFVEGTYRTQPTERVLVGHSFSGVFATYTAFKKPGLFRRIMAGSPSLQHFQGALLAELDRFVVTANVPPLRMDLSFGAQELNMATYPVFEQRVKAVNLPGVKIRTTVYPDENHTSVKAVAFAQAMRWLWRND